MRSHTDTLYSSGQSACWEYGLTCHAQPHTSAVSTLATGDECWEEMTVTQRTRFPDVRVSTHQCKADWCAYVCAVTLYEHTLRGTHYARPTVRLAACLSASTFPCCLYASVRVRVLFLAHSALMCTWHPSAYSCCSDCPLSLSLSGLILGVKGHPCGLHDRMQNVNLT